MKISSSIFIIVASIVFMHTTKADTIDNAIKLCAVFDSTGLLSESCKVEGLHQSVTVSIDTSSVEALQICKQASGMLLKDKIKFDKGWKINIFSPFSNGKTIATCKLPS
jgi:hypothetical protein